MLKISGLIIFSIWTGLLLISYSQADQTQGGVISQAIASFQKKLKALPAPEKNQDEDRWVQAINKSEKCLIITSQEFLNKPNPMTYWDGHCEKGYARGLGRNIEISDTSHTEVVTVYYPDINIIRPYYIFDHINLSIGIGKYNYRNRSFSGKYERITINKEHGYDRKGFTGIVNAVKQNSALMHYSPFSHETSLRMTNDSKIGYYRRDFTKAPSNLNYSIGMYSVADSKEGGARRLIYRNNNYHDEAIIDSSFEIHTPDDSAWEGTFNELNKGYEKVNLAQYDFEYASKVTTPYLQKLCSSRVKTITELTQDQYFLICNWSDPYEEIHKRRLMEFEEETKLAWKKINEDKKHYSNLN